eukprot:CAMPEP_0202918544 /NCGR_PEP_ID=MMETSP1392-20130828/73705_1 /ASSEMBLY_ACC=CAM_ASM_000868 /TAXON_ID=225041 /ORGANISM="Chlamydomonas chlamydogama, Strain SAG 11-48b" /LENGTH=46 /DNA_ID= /DNA_START= /DNA_END= /DNA_ORIENTATION=
MTKMSHVVFGRERGMMMGTLRSSVITTPMKRSHRVPCCKVATEWRV